MNRREWEQERAYAIESGRRAGDIIRELGVQVQELTERIVFLEGKIATQIERDSNKLRKR